jgi:hypothetical protein
MTHVHSGTVAALLVAQLTVPLPVTSCADLPHDYGTSGHGNGNGNGNSGSFNGNGNSGNFNGNGNSSNFNGNNFSSDFNENFGGREHSILPETWAPQLFEDQPKTDCPPNPDDQ